MSLARDMWRLTEPFHAVVYFAPEHRQAQDAVGLRGGWMAYFASRAAPLGAVSAEVVSALFYNFEPGMVAKALPDAWGYASPQRVLEARYEGVGAALQRIIGSRVEDGSVRDALSLLRQAVNGCELGGRPMFAANLALPWPAEPLLALWHATTLLREHRGDGHVTALLAHGLDGCQAHLMAAASGATTAAQLQPNRGWSDEQWHTAQTRLRQRGLLNVAGELTEQGRQTHGAVDELTDRLATSPWDRLGPAGIQQLVAAMTPMVDAIDAARALPYPNPMGLPQRPAADDLHE